MNKKLLAVAVAGALAAPGVALAQSSVTISGFIKMSLENIRIGNRVAAGLNNSEGRLVDDSSRIVFNVVEDLGGGLRAIAQVDWRIAPDTGADGASIAGGGPQGNNHVGLQSKQWGRIFFGRQDLHYGLRESYLTVKGDLKADSISLLAFIQGSPVANATRTPNVVVYDTPSFGGLDVRVAYSFSPGGGSVSEADMLTGARRGKAWNINPVYTGSNFVIGYSYWNDKPDNPGAATTDTKSHRLAGSYAWGGFRIGAAWDKSKRNLALAGTEVNKRTAWSIPLSYAWGPHEIHGHYTKARDDKATVAQDGAKMWAVSYQYNMSKRTSLALNYAQIRNDTGATYNLFTSTSAAIGSPDAGVVAGEDPRMWSLTIRHAF